MIDGWNRSVDDQGRLLNAKELNKVMENYADWLAYADQVYGMMYFLASALETASGLKVDTSILLAEQLYKGGYKYSPGLNGTNIKILDEAVLFESVEEEV